MKSHLRLRSACALLLAAVFAAASAPALGEEIRNHFDSDSLMRTPGFFDLVVLGAEWNIRSG